MKYSELISFKPIESTIQLLETADKKVAQDMVQTYVMSDTMADNLKATVIDQLQMEEVIDNKAVMIVGNYGTGKSHLMSVIAAIATDAENTAFVQNKKFGKDMEIVAGKFFGSLIMFICCVGIYVLFALTLTFYSAPDWSVFLGNLLGSIILGAAMISIDIFISEIEPFRSNRGIPSLLRTSFFICTSFI